MARAKTTDRANARRRYRAQLAAAEASAAAEAATDEEPAAEPVVANRLSRGAAIANRLGVGRPPAGSASGGGPVRPAARPLSAGRPTPASAQPAPGARLGIVDSFRSASGPADIRADIAAFPSVARHTHAVWLPVAVVVATGVAYLVPALRQNTLVVFLTQALLAPPAMIPSFLAGMLTRRASWLAGAVAGLASGVMAVLVILSVPAGGATQVTTSATDALWILIVGPLFGGAVGAFAGFYRRFLAYSSPNRPQQTRRKTAAKRR